MSRTSDSRRERIHEAAIFENVRDALVVGVMRSHEGFSASLLFGYAMRNARTVRDKSDTDRTRSVHRRAHGRNARSVVGQVKRTCEHYHPRPVRCVVLPAGCTRRIDSKSDLRARAYSRKVAPFDRFSVPVESVAPLLPRRPPYTNAVPPGYLEQQSCLSGSYPVR